ncbi:MAG: PAS domain S-box protein, partial [Thermoanaerobaculia bacterium]|nr:PAS domain S-box protein [Thermoanaerobaculia bacterium]
MSLRIAAINCSTAELAALRSAIADEVVVAQGLIEVPAFDFAIFGSAEIRDGNLPDGARERVRVPAAVIIPLRAMYGSIAPDLGAFTLGELDRVPHVIRQQVELWKGFEERAATQRRQTDRHAEDALRESESRYRTLVEQARDMIFGLDREGRFTSLNRAFETITGWSRVEWIGRPFREILDPASVETASRRFREVLAGAEPTHAEYYLRTRSGQVLTVETTTQVVNGADGPIGTIGITRDITRRKEAEAEVEKAKRLSSLGQLATSVAHEFNNVLMSILPFAELLQRRYSSDELAAIPIQHIISAVHRGREISQEILRYARPPRTAIAPVALGSWLPRAAARIES